VTDIPEVEDPGSEGTQKESAGELLPPESRNTFQQQPIQDAARGLAASSPRSLGGEVGARFIAASVSHLTNDLQETKRELSDTREKLDKTRDQLSNERSDVAAKAERLRSLSGVRHLRNISIAAGTVLMGLAVDFSRSEFSSMSLLLGGLGILIIVMGWIAPKEDER